MNLAPTMERTGAESLLRVKDYLTELVGDCETLLDSRSDFYSRLMEEDVTWRQALRAGVVLPLLFLLAIGCVMSHPLTSLFCLAGAAWVTHRLNKTDEERERKAKRKR